MSLPQPTKCRITSCVVGDVNILNFVNKLSVFESMYKPYFTAKIVVVDDNNVLNLASSNLTERDPAYVAFDAGDGRTWEADFQLLRVKGNESAESGRAQRYEIELVGPEYFNDRQGLVQKSFKGVPGTSAIQAIHGEFIGTALNILMSSLGPISMQNYIVDSKKPFKAIADIRRTLNFAGVGSGNAMYFKNIESHILAPLEALFMQLGAQATFIQKTTWGSSFPRDYTESEYAIIAASALVDPDKFGGNEAAAAGQQEKKVFDLKTKKRLVDKMATGINPGQFVGSILQPLLGSLGGLGGLANYFLMDRAHLPESVDPSLKAEAERLYKALFKDGPMVTVKVPIQGGSECTVGKGVNLQLLPPAGDQNNSLFNKLGGMHLVTELAHHLAVDDRSINGVTVMSCARGGVD